MNRKFTADFETSTLEWVNIDGYARVWAYSICEIGNPDNFIYGNNIEDFIKWCANPKENYILYFHNLKFDSQYIISYLLDNGYTHVTDRKETKDKTFTTLISSMGAYYSIEIYFTKGNKKCNKVTIYDSLKIINMSVDKIAKDFDLPIRKLELDYNAYRPIGHEFTQAEIDYIRNDVEIMARALDIMFNNNLTKMTIGSDALFNYKERLGDKFDYIYPQLDVEIHKDITKAYKGGFTYLNPLYEEQETLDGVVLDVNSLYPSVMRYEILPFGKPIYFDGKYKEDKLHPLYIQVITCSFKLKPGKIPTIQIKNSPNFLPNEYIEDSENELYTMYLTNIDLELFFQNYFVDDLVYGYGYKFRGTSGLFNSYIDSWTNEKIKAKKEKNPSMYKIAKLMLNSLYGKFASGCYAISKVPYIGEDGIVSYKLGELEEKSTVYMPVGAFITAYARRKTITTSQKIRDYSLKKYGKDCYVYSDTDSIHCLFESKELEDGSIILPNDPELSNMIDIDDYNLGWWKIESRFSRGKYLRQKCYIEMDYNDRLNVTVAGLPKKLGKYVDFTNFKKGFAILASEQNKEHKLTYKQVKGGVVLVETDFTIK